MPALKYLGLYALTFLVFIVVDLTWLGFVAQGFYRQNLGKLMLDQPIWPVAIGFYPVSYTHLTLPTIHPV